MPDAEAEALIQSVELTPPNLRYRTAKDLGRRFNVTNAERERLRLWLIAAVDVNPDEIRKAKRKERQRLYRQRVARKAGVRSRRAYLSASVSKQKPWVAEGISRRTWYVKLHNGLHRSVYR
jgi:hypothetical protein